MDAKAILARLQRIDKGFLEDDLEGIVFRSDRLIILALGELARRA